MSDRLEDIKDHYVPYDENFGLDSNDLEWLIEQAEQVELMRKLVNYHQQKQKEAEDENEPYRHQNKRYRESLNKIVENWTTSTDVISGEVLAHTAKEIAREALSKEE